MGVTSRHDKAVFIIHNRLFDIIPSRVGRQRKIGGAKGKSVRASGRESKQKWGWGVMYFRVRCSDFRLQINIAGTSYGFDYRYPHR